MFNSKVCTFSVCNLRREVKAWLRLCSTRHVIFWNMMDKLLAFGSVWMSSETPRQCFQGYCVTALNETCRHSQAFKMMVVLLYAHHIMYTQAFTFGRMFLLFASQRYDGMMSWLMLSQLKHSGKCIWCTGMFLRWHWAWFIRAANDTVSLSH